MSSLPKKSKVTKQPRISRDPKANIPVCNETLVGILMGADEIHQHDKFPHVLMIVRPYVEDESSNPMPSMEAEEERLVICLYCGGTSVLKSPNKVEPDEDGFQLFKQFHGTCPKPKEPVGLFNADEIHREDA